MLMELGRVDERDIGIRNMEKLRWERKESRDGEVMMGFSLQTI